MQDVCIELSLNNQSLTLLGTAHISKQSADDVRQLITEKDPSIVAVELDDKRLEALIKPRDWSKTNLKDIIRKQQLTLLFLQMALAGFQYRLGQNLDVKPGMEMKVAVEEAERLNKSIVCIDRPIHISIKRLWGSLRFFEKLKFFSGVLASIFDRTELEASEIEALKKRDVLEGYISELGKSFPTVERVLIAERDLYMTAKLREIKDGTILAVVGAGHLRGMQSHFENKTAINCQDLELIPTRSIWMGLIGWGVPLIIIGLLTGIGIKNGVAEFWDKALFWILINGSLSALGALIARAHPLAILSAFIAAPITSLTPVIGAGYVVTFVQVLICPPKVEEFVTIIHDVSTVKKWWQNKVLRVFLIFFLSGLGSALGTYLGAFEIIKAYF